MSPPSTRPHRVRQIARLAAGFGSLALGLSAALTSPLAHAAEPGLSRAPAASPFVQLVEDGHAWMNATLTGARRRALPVDGDARRQSARGVATHTGLLAPALLAPQVGVYVRDWRRSMRLAGASSTVLDDVRPSASVRMVLVRVASGDAVAPFIQAGVGQWRLDPQHFPALSSETELAGQIGGGVELRLAQVTVAAEAHQTAMYRERRAGETVPDFPALIGWSLAARGSF